MSPILRSVSLNPGAWSDPYKGKKDHKMRHFKSLSIYIPSLLFTTAILSADSLAVQLSGVGPSDGNYYVLPYELSIDEVGTEAVCYDFNDESSLNQTWSATELTLDQAASGGQFSSLSNGLVGYEQVAWFSSIWFSESLTTEDQIDLQHAIWNVFDPGAFTLPGDPFLNALQAAEPSGIAGLDFDNYQFLEAIPENGYRAQAFVIYKPGNNNGQNPSSSPEPASAILLFIGFGLIGISKLRRGTSRIL
jgi:hypothetical protein